VPVVVVMVVADARGGDWRSRSSRGETQRTPRKGRVKKRQEKRIKLEHKKKREKKRKKEKKLHTREP
jgi:hypothetical protein